MIRASVTPDSGKDQGPAEPHYHAITDNNANVTECVGMAKFTFRAGEFFQVNPFILPALVAHVLTQARAVPGPPIEFLVDAYCGAGLFSISGSKQFTACFGVDISSHSIKYAQINAANNAVNNCKFYCASAESIFASLPSVTARPRGGHSKTAVIIDPSRSGCSTQFLALLVRVL